MRRKQSQLLVRLTWTVQEFDNTLQFLLFAPIFEDVSDRKTEKHHGILKKTINIYKIFETIIQHVGMFLLFFEVVFMAWLKI